jgi:uncharacterized protein
MSNHGNSIMKNTILRLLTASTALLLTAPAYADVKAGVDAWAKGDYAAAINQWRPLAIKGDADAQFNLAQAYRFGRGVTMDMKQAEDWYRRAATQGHLQAEDNLGLIMFQNGDRQGAMRYIERSANRGEPRAQYVLGTALFNGDFLAKDYVRAYALMTRASASGLSRASSSLAQMDRFIPIADRQKGLAMARDMEMRGSRPVGPMPGAGAQVAMGSSQPQTRVQQPIPPAMPPMPRPMPSSPRPVDLEPSDAVPVADPVYTPPVSADPVMPEVTKAAETARDIEASQPAKRGTRVATRGTRQALPSPRRSNRGGPSTAPVSIPDAPMPQPEMNPPPMPADPLPPVYNTPDMPTPSAPQYPVESYPVESYPVEPAPAPVRVAPRPTAKAPVRTAAKATGRYRVQLGAFSDEGRARAQWNRLEGSIGALASTQPYLVKAGAITRLQAGPFGTEAAAQKMCGSVRASGNACIVISQ